MRHILAQKACKILATNNFEERTFHDDSVKVETNVQCAHRSRLNNGTYAITALVSSSEVRMKRYGTGGK